MKESILMDEDEDLEIKQQQNDVNVQFNSKNFEIFVKRRNLVFKNLSDNI